MDSKNAKQRRGLLASFIALVTVAATVAVAAPAQAGPDCGHQFNDSDAPDSHSCRFACKATNQLTIGIHASDTDAVASGSNRCGSGYTPCESSGAANRCEGDTGFAATDDTGGDCGAVVSEMWNSAWSYNCAAIASTGPPGPPSPPDPKDCILGFICCPKPVCQGGADLVGCDFEPGWVAPSPAEVWGRLEGACRVPFSGAAVKTDAASGLPEGVLSRIDVWVTGNGIATGRLCNAGEGCWSILPVCVSDLTAGRMECSVPGAPKILGVAPLFGA